MNHKSPALFLATALFAAGSFILIFTTMGSPSLGQAEKSDSKLQSPEDRLREAWRLNDSGYDHESIGEYQVALELYKQAVALFSSLQDQKIKRVVYNNIGTTYRLLDEPQKAMEYFKLARAVCEAAGDRGGVGAALINIASLHSGAGDFQKALDLYFKALDLIRAGGNVRDFREKRNEAVTLACIAEMQIKLGQAEKALAFVNQSLDLARAIADQDAEVYGLSVLGWASLKLGRNQEAQEYLSQALAMLKEVPHPTSDVADLLHDLGNVYKAMGDNQKALHYFDQSQKLWEAEGDRKEQSHVLEDMSKTYESMGDKQKAVDYHNQAARLKQSLRLNNKH